MRSVTTRILLLSFIIAIFFSCKKKEVDTPAPPAPPLSNNKSISSFIIQQSKNTGYLNSDITGIIENDTIKLTVPAETDISNLIPSINIKGKSLSPANEIAQNFASPVQYIVTAENGSSKKLTVIISFRATLFFESLDGSLYAVDANDGAEIWKTHNGKFFSGSPSVYKGLVYACGSDGLYAVDAKTGIEKWKFQITTTNTPYEIYPSPVTKEGVVYIGLWDGFVYAINTSDGSLKWKINNQSGKPFISNVTLNGNLLYAGCGDSYLYAIDISTGSVVWKYFTGNPIYKNPLIIDNNVFAGGVNENHVLLNGLTGAVIWSASGDLQTASPTYYNGIIYSGGGNRASGYNAITGQQEWYFSHGNATYLEKSSGTVFNGKFYGGSNDGNFYAVDIATKNIIWSMAANSYFVYSSPVIVDGILYVGTPGQDMYAINAETGVVKWKKNISGAIIGSACVIDKMGVKHYASVSGEQN